MSEANRKLAAIVAADVAGYSRSMARGEARTLLELRLLRHDILGPLVDAYRGAIIKSMGDGWLIEFASATDAVNCAIEVQKRLVGHELVQLRMGVHLGDLVHEDDDVFGDGVNIAARLQTLSRPGGIIISDVVQRSIEAQPRAEFVNLGARSLKNIPNPVLIFGWRGGDFVQGETAEAADLPDRADTEHLVVSLARTGDRDAFAELVKRHQSWIRNLMRRSCGDATLADDLAQQVFLQAWTTIGSLRDPSRFRGWLRRLAINIWLAYARKNDALRDADTYEEADGSQTVASGTAVDLDRALAMLPPTVRLCVVLAYHEGMTHPEIADYTHLPLGTVKSNIRRGTERLRSLLSDYRGEPKLENTND